MQKVLTCTLSLLQKKNMSKGETNNNKRQDQQQQKNMQTIKTLNLPQTC